MPYDVHAARDPPHEARGVQLTPYVKPEFLQASPAEAVDSEDKRRRSSKRGAKDGSVGSSVVTPGQTVESRRKGNDESDLCAIVGEKATVFDGHEPHANAESAKKTAKTFGDFLEHQG